jgi:hypothetical protein
VAPLASPSAAAAALRRQQLRVEARLIQSRQRRHDGLGLLDGYRGTKARDFRSIAEEPMFEDSPLEEGESNSRSPVGVDT